MALVLSVSSRPEELVCECVSPGEVRGVLARPCAAFLGSQGLPVLGAEVLFELLTTLMLVNKCWRV